MICLIKKATKATIRRIRE